MISANLQQWIQHPETLNKDTLYELRTLVTRYPYFQSLRLLYLKNLYLLHDISFGAELRKAILHVADRRKLFYLIEGERYILKPRKKNALPETEVLEEEPSLDRTLSLIDAFLATVPEEVSAQPSLDYATDYTTYLLQEDDTPELEETPKLRGHELIDGFIEPGRGPPPESPAGGSGTQSGAWDTSFQSAWRGIIPYRRRFCTIKSKRFWPWAMRFSHAKDSISEG